MSKQLLTRVPVFFLLAFGISFVFSKLPAVHFYSVNLIDILCGFGPLIAGWVCYQWFKTPTTYSLGGTQPVKSWLIVLITALVFLITDRSESFAARMLFLVSQLLYCFGEEFGWRHYLQSETNRLNKWLQAFLIGLVWFAWHFSWLQDPLKTLLGQNNHAPLPVSIGMAVLFLTLFSSLLGWFVRTTDSILLPTLVHFATKANSPTLAVALSLSLVAVLTWNRFQLGKQREPAKMPVGNQ